MEVTVGLRVVRGPNWTWQDQDGGVGSVGTVVELHKSERAGGERRPVVVTVQWDAGTRCRYRCGIGDSYDLRVLDSAPVGVCHVNVVCEGCGSEMITGIRWKCIRCVDVDVCTSCYGSGTHNPKHEFIRMDAPGLSIRFNARQNSKRVEARGIFKGAKVNLIPDSKPPDINPTPPSDLGTVISVQGKDYDNSRGFVEVEWSSGKMLCQVGHQGKVDVLCVESASGGYYYPDHLPVLGAPLPPPDPHLISAGDLVRVELDPDVFRAMQKGHGGWNEPMVEVIDKIGTVQAVLETGDLRVNYSEPMSSTWTLCHEAVVKVDLPQFRIGDLVKVVKSSHKEGARLRSTSTFMKLLGQTGQVIQSFSDGMVMVAIKGVSYLFRPIYLERIPFAESASVWEPRKDKDVSVSMTLRSMAEAGDPEVVHSAAIATEIIILKDFLDKYPERVDYLWRGRTALQMVSIGGNAGTIRVLLDHGANTNVVDSGGYTPLHHAVVSGSAEAVSAFLAGGADVNCKVKEGFTPLMTAAFRGTVAVLKRLLDDPKINLHEQDGDGNTALHCAVLSQKVHCISILLEAGADPSLLNFRLHTPIHDAVRMNCLPAVEQLLRAHPEHINISVDTDFTPLHMAALVGAYDIICLLIKMGCNVNALTETKQTALHVALMQGYTSVVEALVVGGADLSLGDSYSNTALHALVLMRTTMELPNDDAPIMTKIHYLLFGDMSDNDGTVCVCVSVIFFLIYRGANIYAKSKKGNRPVDLFPYLTTLKTLCTEHSHEIERPEGPQVSGLMSTYGHTISLVTDGRSSRRTGSMVLGRGKLRPVGGAGPMTDRQYDDQSTTPSYHGYNYGNYEGEDEDFDEEEGAYFVGYPRQHSYPEQSHGDESVKSPQAGSGGMGQLYDQGYEFGTEGSVRGGEAWPQRELHGGGVGGLSDQPRSKFAYSAYETSPPPPELPPDSTQPCNDDKVSLCFLCDNPADVTFSPCGHSSMCQECAPRAKRCPTCKNPVDGFTPT